MQKPLKISFCTTCKGRLEHLKQTLPVNLRNNPDAEFVILDYGSEDGLAEWVKQNYQAELAFGKIRYARYEADHFKMAHAKNMAHRLATGDVLCNLDADNITAPGFANWLSKEFAADPNIYVRPSHRTVMLRQCGGKLKMKVLSVAATTCDNPPAELLAKASLNGIYGRIAISRDNFMKLQGYEEAHHKGWGSDDKKIENDDDNLEHNSLWHGLKRVDLPIAMYGSVLGHSNAMRIQNLPEEIKQNSEQQLQEVQGMAKAKWQKFEDRLRRFARPKSKAPSVAPVSNTNGEFGCGKVCINFGDEMELMAVPPDMAQLRLMSANQSPLGNSCPVR